MNIPAEANIEEIARGMCMKLEGNAEKVLSWIVEMGQPSGDSGVAWDLDDNGPIYFTTPAGTSVANQGEYIVWGQDGEFYASPTTP